MCRRDDAPPHPDPIDCAMVPDGTDTNGDEWNRCTTHDRLVLGDAYVCEGYEPPPYIERQPYTVSDSLARQNAYMHAHQDDKEATE